eukprot:GHVS01082726.1.p1 GENE.GHVS01082726.1~~GHVS01082726.1.p1  ORF type:complete len:586 (+),score=91.40 GHVS01082726.1:276-2033(+)
MLSLHHHDHHSSSAAAPPVYLHPLFSCSFSTSSAAKTSPHNTKNRFTATQHYHRGIVPVQPRRPPVSFSGVRPAGAEMVGVSTGLQLSSFSQGKNQPMGWASPRPCFPSHTTPASSLSSTATPTTSSPSTDSSSTTPAQQPLVSTSRAHNRQQGSRQQQLAEQYRVGMHNKYSTQHRHMPPLSASSAPLVEINPQPPPISTSSLCRLPLPPPPFLPCLPLNGMQSRPAPADRSPPRFGAGAGWRQTASRHGGLSCREHSSFACECVSRQIGGWDGGGESRLRTSVIGRCQTTTRTGSGGSVQSNSTTRPIIKSLCGGTSGMMIETMTTTTTNGSSGGGVMSRVCTDLSEEEVGCCLLSGSSVVVPCTTAALCGGGSFGRADDTAEAIAFLKYKIGHMSPTLMLVCFNFAEMCWSRFRNMDILGAVDLMPHPSQGSSPSENKSTKPSTRLSLSKAAALLIAFLARYRLHEDDIVAVLCTAYSYLQSMDTPTLQPLVRQMVLWFYPSNILYFLAFLAHIHVLDDTIPLKCWGQRLSEGVAKGSNVNKCVRNLLRMMKYRLEVDLESYGQSYRSLHSHKKHYCPLGYM